MSTSRIPAVVKALRDTAQAALPDLDVRLGPPSGELPERGLFVNDTSDDEAEFRQSWAGNGARARNEDFDLPCLLYRDTGDNDQDTVSAEMDAVFADFATVENLLRSGDLNLGVTGFSVECEVAEGAWSQDPSDGLVTRLRFTVHVKTRI